MQDTSPDADQNPYHPFEETARYRAFRDGWAARREREPRSANPYPFAQTGRALAWLDGWTAAAGEHDETRRRQRREAHRVRHLDRTLAGIDEGASEST